MNKDELLKLAGNPKFISGIYNYCDRWCERCSFASRCLNYAMGEKDSESDESSDMDNEKFWDKISENFKLAMELLQDEVERLGINIDSEEVQEITKKEELLFDSIQKHEIIIIAKNYAELVTNFFEENEKQFHTKEEEINTKIELDLPNAKPFDDYYEINDVVEVIRWYQYQISIKLTRAFSSKLEDLVEEDPIQNDSNGSAKVAVIGIERSISAWVKLMKHFSEKEDDILKILIRLNELRIKTEKEFPDTKLFIRPGFDEIKK